MFVKIMEVPKEYRIETLTDIFNMITKENVESFLADLNMYIANLPQLKENGYEYISNGFTWIDDGKNEALFYFVPEGMEELPKV